MNKNSALTENSSREDIIKTLPYAMQVEYKKNPNWTIYPNTDCDFWDICEYTEIVWKKYQKQYQEYKLGLRKWGDIFNRIGMADTSNKHMLNQLVHHMDSYDSKSSLSGFFFAQPLQRPDDPTFTTEYYKYRGWDTEEEEKKVEEQVF